MTDRVIVITGASSGIGAALAERVARAGASVVLVARREAALADVAGRCGTNVLTVAADVTVRADVARVVEAAIARFGRIDVWVNNAGRGISRMPTELTEADLDEMFAVNVKSVFYGMQEVLPHFRSRNAGHIINVSSLLGRVPLAVIRSAYSASKHYMNAMTALFRAELQQTHPGIHISIVSPGVVATDFGLNATHGGPDSRSLPGAQSVDEVAEVIAGVIETRHPDVYTRPDGRAMVVKYYESLGV